MSIDHGMNIDEVNALAQALTTTADKVQRHAAELDRLVRRFGWAGPVGARFRGEWWPQHRGAALQMAADLRSFADAARANVNDQRQASSANGSAPRMYRALAPGMAPRDWDRTISNAIFIGGKIVDLREFVGTFNDLRHLDALSGLARPASSMKLGPMGALGFSWDIYHLFRATADGSWDGGIRSGIDVAFDIGGVALPQVALGKGAWDVGWQVGKGIDWFFGEHLGGHQAFIDSVIVEKYGGTLTTAEADDLAHRYDGWSGFGNWVGDNFTNTGNAAKSLWKSVFG